METKLVFLDMDGVLVPFKPLNYGVYLANLVHFEHNGMRESFSPLDKSCVEQLNRITDETGAKIVLSTAWREYFISCYESHPRPEMAVYLAYLKHCGVKADIIGWTPHGDDADSKGVRGVEIRKFIYRYLKKGKKYESMVILDDRDDMEEFTKYLVQTDPYQGITEEIANRAIKVLNGTI